MTKGLLQYLLMTTMLFMCFPSLKAQTKGSVTVTIKGLRSKKGAVLVSLYNTGDHFPDDAAKYAIGKGKTNIVNGAATIIFQDLPYGRYAIAVLHDENNNQKMDTNFLGIPKEGYGFSNDARGTFGPPSFQKAAFQLNAHEKAISIKTSYFF